jgi:glycosyl transferase family 25
MKIFVLHYSKLTDRKEHILDQFKKHNIREFTFIENFDKDEITEDQCPEFDQNYITNKRSCLSLHLKHIYAYKLMITENIDEALIFEDDVILSDDFMSKLTNYMTQVPRDYDMVFIGDACQLHIPTSQLVPNQNIYKKSVDTNDEGYGGATRCTDSYIIHNRCAKKICEYIKNLKYKINSPVDWWLNVTARDNNLSVYWAEPTIVTQGTHTGLFPTSL